jgi:four helix bundle protein
MARGALYEFETQLDLASGLGFINAEATERILDLATQTAKLINGLLRSVDPERAAQKRQPAN